MFKIASMGALAKSPVEYYTTTAEETIFIGEVLSLSSGTLTKCAATSTPEFIALKAATDTAVIPVVRVMEDMELDAPLTADARSVAVGSKVTIASTGLGVTATTSSGVFQINKYLGDGTSGTHVLGMFRR